MASSPVVIVLMVDRGSVHQPGKPITPALKGYQELFAPISQVKRKGASSLITVMPRHPGQGSTLQTSTLRRDHQFHKRTCHVYTTCHVTSFQGSDPLPLPPLWRAEG